MLAFNANLSNILPSEGYDHCDMLKGQMADNITYIGGTAYFGHVPSPMHEEGWGMPVLDNPPGGKFMAVDCKWKEVVEIPVEAIAQVTRASSTQRHTLARERVTNRRGPPVHPNICEDFLAGRCENGYACKLFHVNPEWLMDHRRPHQEALEQAKAEFERMQRTGRSFTVFCPDLKETIPVPAEHMHFTRGLLLREEERARRQAQHGGKQSDSHQNPSVCQLFIKGGGDRQCKWGELCNQAHPNKEWLLERHEMSVRYVQACRQQFDATPDTATWEALDPDTNERLVIPKAYLYFTRGLYAKEYSGTRLASICMLFLKRYDGARDGCGCTANQLCNQVHVNMQWIVEQRILIRRRSGELDDARHRADNYQGVHFPPGRRAPMPPALSTNPVGVPSGARWGSTPGAQRWTPPTQQLGYSSQRMSANAGNTQWRLPSSPTASSITSSVATVGPGSDTSSTSPAICPNVVNPAVERISLSGTQTPEKGGTPPSGALHTPGLQPWNVTPQPSMWAMQQPKQGQLNTPPMKSQIPIIPTPPSPPLNETEEAESPAKSQAEIKKNASINDLDDDIYSTMARLLGGDSCDDLEAKDKYSPLWAEGVKASNLSKWSQPPKEHSPVPEALAEAANEMASPIGPKTSKPANEEGDGSFPGFSLETLLSLQAEAKAEDRKPSPKEGNSSS
eukprot:Sspe_Gene.70977::Locus_41959_Transcript_1_1_Confidence_1.000_Length_2290::g.70977::m.70977